MTRAPRAKPSIRKQPSKAKPPTALPLGLEEEPKRVLPPTKEQMEAWHKSLARAGSLLSLTLARRRMSKTMVDDILQLIAPLVEEMRNHQ